MKLSTLMYYIEEEKDPIQRIFINFNDWDKLLEQIRINEDPIIHVNNWFNINDISVHKNNHQVVNWATFVIIRGNPADESNYSFYNIEILTENEKIIKNIIE